MESDVWSDVDHLNRLAHDTRVAAGEVAPGGIEYFGQPIGAGDEVRLQKGDERGLGVINGTEGTVVAIDVEKASITIEECRTNREIELPKAYLYDPAEAGPTLRLSYCRTSYGVQGGTWADYTFTYARPEHASAESLFVNFTRARRGNYLYRVWADRRPEEDVHLPALDLNPPKERLGTSMARDVAKRVAIDLVGGAEQAAEAAPAALAPAINWGPRAGDRASTLVDR